MHKDYKLKIRSLITTTLLIATVSLFGACFVPERDTKPLIPDSSWDCGMPEGIPSPESGELVFEAELNLGSIHNVGQTQYGHRHVIEVTGGAVNGPDIAAEVMNGGLDYQLTLSNGAMEIDQINVLKTSDDNYIYMRTCGAAADASEVRIVPDFEAPNSSRYRFLNRGIYAGTRKLDAEGKTMKLRVYDVSNVMVDSRASGAVRVIQPRDVPDQSWECRQASETEEKGEKLISEAVTLGTSFMVGNSKNGLRNIMPISGGTVSGDISGKVLFGGADYQLFKIAGINIDARYNIETDDGELIIIRNCGRMTLPVPTFETRVDSAYSYLNDGRYLGAMPMPNLSITQVNIKIFKSVDSQ